MSVQVSHVVTAPQFVMWQHRERVLPGTTRTYSAQHGLVTKSVLNIDQVNSVKVLWTIKITYLYVYSPIFTEDYSPKIVYSNSIGVVCI